MKLQKHTDKFYWKYMFIHYNKTNTLNLTTQIATLQTLQTTAKIIIINHIV